MNFTSLKAYNLNFLINFGHTATQFLTDIPTGVCLIAKIGQKIQIMALETSKICCFQNLVFVLQTMMTCHFLAS